MILSWDYNMLLKFMVGVCVFSVHFSIRLGSGKGNRGTR